MKQPLFQFRYEGKTGKYIRELKDSLSVDNAVKDPNFVNGVYKSPDDNLEFACMDFMQDKLATAGEDPKAEVVSTPAAPGTTVPTEGTN